MDLHHLTRELQLKNDSKIVMLVADGLGGLPLEPGGLTELETANTPHLDALAKRGVSGLSIPVKPGITPGSGPGHLALFGYDPLQYVIGRGALEATGIGFELQEGDVAVRANFCTLDSARDFVAQACKLLAGQPKANGVTLRGFSGKPNLPSYEEVYGLRAAAIAVYPMYKGLARLVGMDIVGQPQTLDEQMTLLEQNWAKYDFFFIH